MGRVNSAGISTAEMTERTNWKTQSIQRAWDAGPRIEYLDFNGQMVEKRIALPWLLHAACSRGDADEVTRLVNAGASVDAEPPTPLIKAAYWGHCGVAQALISLKADVTKTNDEQHTALMVAVSRGRQNFVRLLLQQNADVSWRNQRGTTALDLAIDRPEILKLLEGHVGMEVLPPVHCVDLLHLVVSVLAM